MLMSKLFRGAVLVAATTLLPLVGVAPQASANPPGVTVTKCVDFSYRQPFRTAVPIYGWWKDRNAVYTLVMHHSFCRGHQTANPSVKVAWFNAPPRSHRYVSNEESENFAVGECGNQSDAVNAPTSAPIYTSCQFDVAYVERETTPSQGRLKIYAYGNQDFSRDDEATGGYEIDPGDKVTRRYTMAVNPVNGCVYVSGIGRTDPVACYS
jgi:hypothetical protein